MNPEKIALKAIAECLLDDKFHVVCEKRQNRTYYQIYITFGQQNFMLRINDDEICIYDVIDLPSSSVLMTDSVYATPGTPSIPWDYYVLCEKFNLSDVNIIKKIKKHISEHHQYHDNATSIYTTTTTSNTTTISTATISASASSC